MAAPKCSCDTYGKSGLRNTCSTAGELNIRIASLRKEMSVARAEIERLKGVSAKDKGYVSMADLLSNVSVKGNEMTLKLDDFEPVATYGLLKQLIRETYAGKPSYYNEEQIDSGCHDLAVKLEESAVKLGTILYTASQMQQLIDKCNAKDAELAAARAEIERLKFALADTEALELGTSERCEKQQKQLASRDLVIQQKDEALENIKLRAVSLADAQVFALEALALQPTPEALDAYVADKVADKQKYIDTVQLAVATVYMEITGGLCSKENTPASVVVGLYNEHINSIIAEAVAECKTESRAQALFDAADDFEMGATADEIRQNAEDIRARKDK